MENNIIRVTKAQKLEAIKSAIPADFRHVFPGATDANGNTTKAAYVLDHDEAVAFIDKELALLAKKNSGDKKLTKDQEANEGYKELILDYLSKLPAEGEGSEGVTCTQMFKEIPAFAEYSPQKVSALCRQLKLAGLITSKEVKGKTLFSLA